MTTIKETNVELEGMGAQDEELGCSLIEAAANMPLAPATKLPAMPPKNVLQERPVTVEVMREQALYVALQPDFLAEVEANIGEPKVGESRSEFVERAKAAVISRLSAIFEGGRVDDSTGIDKGDRSSAPMIDTTP